MQTKQVQPLGTDVNPPGLESESASVDSSVRDSVSLKEAYLLTPETTPSRVVKQSRTSGDLSNSATACAQPVQTHSTQGTDDII